MKEFPSASYDQWKTRSDRDDQPELEPDEFYICRHCGRPAPLMNEDGVEFFNCERCGSFTSYPE